MTEQPMLKPEPVATELDSISDWVTRLANARKAKKLAEEVERDCKEQIEELLAQKGATVGTVGGQPAVLMTTISKRTAPSVAVLEKVAPEILEQYGKRTEYRTLKLIGD